MRWMYIVGACTNSQTKGKNWRIKGGKVKKDKLKKKKGKFFSLTTAGVSSNERLIAFHYYASYTWYFFFF